LTNLSQGSERAHALPICLVDGPFANLGYQRSKSTSGNPTERQFRQQADYETHTAVERAADQQKEQLAGRFSEVRFVFAAQ
jgi:hypothetical protein